jgi:acetolactate synthase-1/2/3 large subunit
VILSEYLHQQLAAAGASHAFGVPGYFVMPVWQAFAKEPGIVLARHESAAAFMADGFARATGRLGVVLATSGPGMTNCVTGVVCAYRDSVPMLVVTGQAPTSTFGRGAFLESYVLDRAVSPAALLAPITKKSLEIVDPANAAFLIDSAIALALAGRKGPVHLSIPVDLQRQEIPIPDCRSSTRRATSRVPILALADGHRISEAAELLRAAQRPLVLAGWGVMLGGAQDEIARLAELLGAPVVTSTKAASCLPAEHPQRLGHLGPGQRSDITSTVLSYQPDVVLVVGASMSTFYAEAISPALARATLIRIDIDPDQIDLRSRVDVGIVGDARDAATVLTSILAVGERASRADPAAGLVRAFQERARVAVARQPRESRGMVSMAGTIARLSAMLPPDAVVLPDAGNHWLDTIALHQPARAGGLQLNCGIGAMGWAIGASVGMALAASHERAVGRPPLTVCITGDGSMLMHGTELSVAAEHELNLLVIVFNNRSHGRVRLGQRMDFDSDPIGTDLPNLDFSQWMAAMGLRTFRIERVDQAEATLTAALATHGTVGVEVLCHPDEVPASLRDWIEDGE